MLNPIQIMGRAAMATTFVIACPECGKQVKVTDEHVGKKVKCKACGTVYPVKDPAGKGPPPAPAKAKSKPTQAKAPTKAEVPEPPAEEPSTGYRFEDDDDENAPKQYSLAQTDDHLPRCPFCAKEMESHEALICLNCGYNTRTRTRPNVQQVYAPTFGEYFIWLLPGIMCVLTMIGLLVWYIIFWLRIVGWMSDSVFEDEKGPPVTYLGGLGPGFCRLYLALITLAIYVPLTRIAWRRLVKNNRPPETKIKDDFE
jgi:predicted Zn finger-like uncharacterized protein